MNSLYLQITTNIILAIQILFDSVMGIFICYMLMVFSRLNTTRPITIENERENGGSVSEVVPNLVYLQNKKTIKNYLQDQLNDKVRDKELAVL